MNVKDRITRVLAQHPCERGALIPILQSLQDEIGYLPEEAMTKAAEYLGMPESAVYGVVTFYAQFYLTRQGKHRVKVCRGTACHVRGGRRIMQVVKRKLGIGPGETTPDYQFSLERVACLGSCALAPAMVVDDKVYGPVTPADTERLIDGLLKDPDTVEKTEGAPSVREP